METAPGLGNLIQGLITGKKRTPASDISPYCPDVELEASFFSFGLQGMWTAEWVCTPKCIVGNSAATVRKTLSTGWDDTEWRASPRSHCVLRKVPPIVDTSALKIVFADSCIISVVATIGRTAEHAFLALPNLSSALIILADPRVSGLTGFARQIVSNKMFELL